MTSLVLDRARTSADLHRAMADFMPAPTPERLSARIADALAAEFLKMAEAVAAYVPEVPVELTGAARFLNHLHNRGSLPNALIGFTETSRDALWLGRVDEEYAIHKELGGFAVLNSIFAELSSYFTPWDALADVLRRIVDDLDDAGHRQVTPIILAACVRLDGHAATVHRRKISVTVAGRVLVAARVGKTPTWTLTDSYGDSALSGRKPSATWDTLVRHIDWLTRAAARRALCLPPGWTALQDAEFTASLVRLDAIR